MPPGGFRIVDADGVRVVRCDALDRIDGIAHAFSTRIAHGRPDFDMGPAGPASSEVAARRAALLRAAGLSGPPPAVLRQVHGAELVEDPDTIEGDGGVVDLRADRRAPPAVRAADCVPVLLADRAGRALASAHAGWRGTVAGIVPGAVRRLVEIGVPVEDLVVALGPAIGGCCYEVGPEVVDALEKASGPRSRFSRTLAGGRTTVDLREVQLLQLERAGVRAASVHRAPWCTRCRNDLFFSVRAEGAAAGRSMAVVGPAAQP